MLLVPRCPSPEPRQVCISWIELTTTHSFCFDHAAWIWDGHSSTAQIIIEHLLIMNRGQSTTAALVESRHTCPFFSPDIWTLHPRASFESVLKVLQRVKALVLLHFVVAQRAERKLIEVTGERGWTEHAVLWGKRMEGACGGVPVGYRALIRNDGISDRFKNKSDGILAQKVATMAY